MKRFKIQTVGTASKSIPGHACQRLFKAVSGFGHARVFRRRPKTFPPAADEAFRHTPEKPLVPKAPNRVNL